MLEWPQMFYIVYFTVAITVSLFKHGESSGNFNFFINSALVSLQIWVLYKGGFWTGDI